MALNACTLCESVISMGIGDHTLGTFTSKMSERRKVGENVLELSITLLRSENESCFTSGKVIFLFDASA